MIKKIIMLAMAVGAVAALVAPGVASATKLTMPSGTLVPVGTAITGTANNTTIRLHTETETFGDLECKNIMLNGSVTKNNGTTAEGVGTEGSTTSECSIEGEIPINVHSIKIINLKSTEVGAETGTGTFEAEYTATIPDTVICKFSTNGKPGIFHFKVNTDKLIITPTPVNNAGCGGSTLTGEVTLETTDGTPVTAS